jgi:hypothetical protein
MFSWKAVLQLIEVLQLRKHHKTLYMSADSSLRSLCRAIKVDATSAQANLFEFFILPDIFVIPIVLEWSVSAAICKQNEIIRVCDTVYMP